MKCEFTCDLAYENSGGVCVESTPSISNVSITPLSGTAPQTVSVTFDTETRVVQSVDFDGTLDAV